MAISKGEAIASLIEQLIDAKLETERINQKNLGLVLKNEPVNMELVHENQFFINGLKKQIANAFGD